MIGDYLEHLENKELHL